MRCSICTEMLVGMGSSIPVGWIRAELHSASRSQYFCFCPRETVERELELMRQYLASATIKVDQAEPLRVSSSSARPKPQKVEDPKKAKYKRRR